MAAISRYPDALRRSPSQGGPTKTRRNAIAFSTATATLQTNANSSCGNGIATLSSAATWAGKTASTYIHQRRCGTASNAQSRTTFGGQNGANICVSVPITKAA